MKNKILFSLSLLCTLLGTSIAVSTWFFAYPLFGIHHFQKEWSIWPNTEIVEYHTDVTAAKKYGFLGLYILSNQADPQSQMLAFLPSEGIDAFEEGFAPEEGMWVSGFRVGQKTVLLSMESPGFEIPSEVLSVYINRLQWRFSLLILFGLVLVYTGFRIAKIRKNALLRSRVSD